MTVLQFPELIASFFSRLNLPTMGSLPAAPTRIVAGSVPSFTARQVEVLLQYYTKFNTYNC